MKSGVAAMTTAAIRASEFSNRNSGLRIIFSAAEENACQGVNDLVENKELLGQAGAIVIGEPTSNYPIIGHKGAFWLQIRTKGKSAHGSMPEEGENAIYKMAEIISKLQAYQFKCQANPILGLPTLNVGKIEGGVNYNLVPDSSVIYVDIRTIPGLPHNELLEDLKKTLGPEAEISITTDTEGVASSPENAWIKEAYKISGKYLGETPEPRGVAYFTDASALARFYNNPPVILLGPGEAAMCHQTDEFCYTEKIITATEIYTQLAESWLCN
jgi:succinyl-diaminopimelate desuccinylase